MANKVYVPIDNVFVAIEGIDGAGKTLVAKLAEELVHTTDLVPLRQPGATYIGRRVRKMLLTSTGPAPSARVQQRLFGAAMLDACEQVVEPALAAGKGVLTDRWSGSTWAYGLTYGMGVDELSMATWGIRDPDVTVLLDIDPVIAQERKAPENRFDSAGLDMQRRVREAYLERAAADPLGRWQVIDAAQSPNDLAWHVASIFVKPELQGGTRSGAS